MVPNSRPMSQCASPQRAQQRLDLVRGRRVVRSRSAPTPPSEQRVAHRSADQRELVPGRAEEPARQRVEAARRVRAASDFGTPRAALVSGIGARRIEGRHTCKPARRADPPRRSRPFAARELPASAERVARRRPAGTSYSDLMPTDPRAVTTPCGRRGLVRRPSRGARSTVVEETSAGGIVVEWREGVAHAAVIARLNRAGPARVVPAQGAPGGTETPEEAAVREIAEETGIEGRGPAQSRQHRLLVLGDGHRIHKDGPPLPAGGHRAGT